MCTLTGIALGGVADAYRSWLGTVRPARWLGCITDVLFAGVCLLGAVIGLLLADWGSVRIYSLLGAGTGLALYFWLASPLLLPVITGILRAERRTRRAAVVVGARPFRFLRKRSLAGVRSVGRWTVAAVRRIHWSQPRQRR